MVEQAEPRWGDARALVPTGPPTTSGTAVSGPDIPSEYNGRCESCAVSIASSFKINESLNSTDFLVYVEVGVCVLMTFRWDSSRLHEINLYFLDLK